MTNQEATEQPDKDEAVAAGSKSGYIGTNPNETAGEHESMAVADSEHKQEPGQQMGGGQSGG